MWDTMALAYAVRINDTSSRNISVRRASVRRGNFCATSWKLFYVAIQTTRIFPFANIIPHFINCPFGIMFLNTVAFLHRKLAVVGISHKCRVQDTTTRTSCIMDQTRRVISYCITVSKRHKSETALCIIFVFRIGS